MRPVKFGSFLSLLFVVVMMISIQSCESCNRPAPEQPVLEQAPVDSSNQTTTDTNASTSNVEVEGEGVE